MGRSIVAVLTGLSLGIVAIAVVQFLNTLAFPLPEGLDVKNQADLAKHIESLPSAALWVVLGSYGLGSFVGAFLASRIARHSPFSHGMIVSFILLGLGFLTALQFPHPAWYLWLVPVVFPAAGLVAIVLERLTA